jgi:hypothetical protein
MNKISILTIICFIISVLDVAAQPKISILPRSVLDLGDIPTNDKVVYYATIRNDGTDTLRITEIKPSCGCTAVLLKENKNILAPADSVQIAINFDTKDMEGKVTKSIEVFSNDKNNPNQKILFSAYVVVKLKIIPQRITFMISDVDSQYTDTIKLINKMKDRPIKILAIKSKLENLTVSMNEKIIPPGGMQQLQLSYKPKYLSFAKGIVEITTDLPKNGKFEVMVFSFKE